MLSMKGYLDKLNNSGKNGSEGFGVSKEGSKVAKYKKKYTKIKRLVKQIIFENAALCDQIAALQEKIIHLIEERNFLFKKLQQFQPLGDLEHPHKAHSVTGSLDGLPRKPSGKKGNRTMSDSADMEYPSKPHSVTGSLDIAARKPANKKGSRTMSDNTDLGKSAKSSKKSTITRKKKIVKSIPLDSSGKPIFPIVLGDFTVHSLGEVCEKSEYHTDELIFPVGYCSTRIYGSLKDPEKQCVYTCKVMDGGHAPRFEIVADTDLDVPIVSTSIDECHSKLLQLINHCLGTEVVNTKGRGADFFGISHPTIHHLIQASPGVRKCKGYVWTKFEVNANYEYVADETEASLSYSALLRSISFSKSHLDPMIKQEIHHDYAGEDNVTALRNILLS